YGRVQHVSGLCGKMRREQSLDSERCQHVSWIVRGKTHNTLVIAGKRSTLRGQWKDVNGLRKDVNGLKWRKMPC
ncbi:hypothetical protein AVEN_179693-1, partial [Araneus ventricosus]